MILTTLLCLPLCAQTQLPAERTPANQEPVAEKPSAEQWWDQLSPEEQREMRLRLEKVQSMPKEQREEMQRRRKVFEQEKEAILKNLSGEERAQFDAMGEREQHRYLRRRVHENMRARGEHLKERHPELGPGRDAFRKMREKQVKQGLEQAATDGWIGDHAVQWLANAPLHEQMLVLMEVKKWEVLEGASRGALWEELGLEEHEQMRISSLPAPEFFQELRALTGNFHGPEGMERGMRRDPNGRGGHRRPGEGPGRGSGPGRGGGEGPGPGGPGRGGPGPGGHPGGPGPEGPGGDAERGERPKKHKSLPR
ncbi:MAG: hypothetical protein ACPG31_05105 [Planctomycetota bacterium]